MKGTELGHGCSILRPEVLEERRGLRETLVAADAEIVVAAEVLRMAVGEERAQKIIGEI